MENATDVTSLKHGGHGVVDCRSKCESRIVLCRNKECSSDSETFSCTLNTKWALCKQTIYGLPLGTIFQPMRINSVPDVECFLKNKKCYMYNQWYDISRVTLYLLQNNPKISLTFTPLTIPIETMYA